MQPMKPITKSTNLLLIIQAIADIRRNSLEPGAEEDIELLCRIDAGKPTREDLELLVDWSARLEEDNQLARGEHFLCREINRLATRS